MKAMENEFQNIGKKMPYQVPEGFFDHITGDTLAEARRRGKSRKYRVLLWSSLAVAASLGAILFLVSLFAPGTRENLPSPIVQSAPGAPSAREKAIPADTDLKVTGKSDTEQQIRPRGREQNQVSENESIESILASIDDEELTAWVQSLKNDPFTEITENNLP